MRAVDLEILKELSEADGIGGREKEISRIVKKYAEGAVDSCFYDNLGSLILVKKSSKANAPKVMLSAHMDEVGFVVRKITKEGYLKLLAAGGDTSCPHRKCVSQRWKARNTQGSLEVARPTGCRQKKRIK